MSCCVCVFFQCALFLRRARSYEWIVFHRFSCFHALNCMLLFYHNSCTVCIETPICWPNSSGRRDISQNLRVLVLSVSPCTASGGASRSMNRGFPGDTSTFGRATKNELWAAKRHSRCVAISSRSVLVLYMRGFFGATWSFFFPASGIPKNGFQFLIAPKKCFFCPKKILTPKTGGDLSFWRTPKPPSTPGQLQTTSLHSPTRT